MKVSLHTTDERRKIGMRLIRALHLAVVVGPILQPPAFFAQTTAHPANLSAATHRALDSLIVAAAQRFEIPGLSVAVGSTDGKIIYIGNTGYADVSRREPVTSATHFRIYSVSKVYAAIVAHQLATQGLTRPRRSRREIPGRPSCLARHNHSLAAAIAYLRHRGLHRRPRISGGGQRRHDQRRRVRATGAASPFALRAGDALAIQQHRLLSPATDHRTHHRTTIRGDAYSANPAAGETFVDVDAMAA